MDQEHLQTTLTRLREYDQNWEAYRALLVSSRTARTRLARLLSAAVDLSYSRPVELADLSTLLTLIQRIRSRLRNFPLSRVEPGTIQWLRAQLGVLESIELFIAARQHAHSNLPRNRSFGEITEG